MSSSLVKFSEDTKTSCYAIAAGMFVVAAAAVTGSLTGRFISGALRLLGIVTLAVAVASLARNAQTLYVGTPDITQDRGAMSSVAACGGLCVVVIAIIVYGTYTLVF